MSEKTTDSIALVPDRVIDGRSQEALENIAVIVEGQSIAALVDRGRRELPIRIDYVGKNIPTQPGEVVTLQGSGGSGTDVSEGPLRVVLEPGSAGG